jgi:hypothetical protein
MRLRHVAAGAASVLLLAACSNGGSTDGAPEPVPGRVSPLTGTSQEQPPNNPAFVVKIENTGGGEPQYGLNKADLVLEELVEGGLTRLAAIFYSNLPTKIGHVRSMRTTDIGIAKPLGATIVASGGADDTYDQVKDAGLTALTEDHGAPGFSSDPAKSRPYNRMLDLEKLNGSAKRNDNISNYFTWGKGPSSTDLAKSNVTSANVDFGSGSTTGWQFTGGKWGRTKERAAAGQAYKADTLLVIFCRVTEAGYNDAAGNPVPETVIQGSGRAVIFSGNTATEANWHKPKLSSPISFTSKSGKAIALKPGNVFIEATPRGGEVTY